MGGLTVSFCTFYILWEHCGLKEKIQEALQELILDYCCCGMGEYVLCILNLIGCMETVNNVVEENTSSTTRRVVRQVTREIINISSKKNDSDDVGKNEETHIEMPEINQKIITSPGGTNHIIKSMAI